MSPLELVKALRDLPHPVVVDYGVNKVRNGWMPVVVLNSYAPYKDIGSNDDFGPNDRQNGTTTYRFGPIQDTAGAAMDVAKSMLGVATNEMSDDWHDGACPVHG